MSPIFGTFWPARANRASNTPQSVVSRGSRGTNKPAQTRQGASRRRGAEERRAPFWPPWRRAPTPSPTAPQNGRRRACHPGNISRKGSTEKIVHSERRSRAWSGPFCSSGQQPGSGTEAGTSCSSRRPRGASLAARLGTGPSQGPSWKIPPPGAALRRRKCARRRSPAARVISPGSG